MQLVWSENIARHTGKPVLILTPVAVAHQTVAEAEKFGIEALRSPDGQIRSRIVVTNYERLHLFDSTQFAGVVCDESSILKSFDGARRTEITEFMRKLPYRLLATATAAPNDYIELRTSSEALGYLGHMDMLMRFFKNDLNNSASGRAWGDVVPYNTGNAFEHYDDGLEHSIWLSLMKRRIEILHRLLRDDGTLWISIDGDECHYLKVRCDEIFGRRNFVNNVIWEKKYSPQNDAKWLSDSHDHILVYAKNKDIWRPNLLPRTEEMDS